MIVTRYNYLRPSTVDEIIQPIPKNKRYEITNTLIAWSTTLKNWNGLTYQQET